jgi:hypothetical protein
MLDGPFRTISEVQEEEEALRVEMCHAAVRKMGPRLSF